MERHLKTRRSRIMDHSRDIRIASNKFSTIPKALKISELASVPCFTSDEGKWYAAEELTLLAAMLTYGYGNWSVIAATMTKYCKKDFTANEVQAHYNDVYWEGPVGRAIGRSGIPRLRSSFIDHTRTNDPDLISSDIKTHLAVPERFLKEIGYMPLREDFAYDSSPNAEAIIKRVSFAKKLQDFDKNLNLVQLDAYGEVVKERHWDRKMIKELRIVEGFYKFHSDMESKKAAKLDDETPSDPDSILPSKDKPVRVEEQITVSEMAKRYSEWLENQQKKAPEVIFLADEVRRSPRFQEQDVKPIPIVKKTAVSNLKRKLRSQTAIEEEPEIVYSGPSKLKKGKTTVCKEIIESNELKQGKQNSIPLEIIVASSSYEPPAPIIPCLNYLSEDEKKILLEIKLSPRKYTLLKATLLMESLNRRRGKANPIILPEGLSPAQSICIYQYLRASKLIKCYLKEFSED